MTHVPPPAIYTKPYPSLSEAETFPLTQLKAVVAELEDDVAMMEEEGRILGTHLSAPRDPHDPRPDDDDDASVPAAPAGKRRGRAFRRKSGDVRDVFLPLDDKQTLLIGEQDRLKGERLRAQRTADEARELLAAMAEEAQSRVKEVRLETAHFRREVLGNYDENDVVGEKLLKYLADFPASQEAYTTKLKNKCTVMQQQVSKAASQLLQREDVGEEFHAIDFDQLKIENHQFQERIEQKNAELVELKATTTRTVQALNKLTDTLNALTAEQTQLRRELKSREDHSKKLETEIEQVQGEMETARHRNEALKLQHEAVRVPKVEDYIAQKAEMHELERAAKNWRRKVEIAAGHVSVMKQQMLSLKRKKTLLTSQPTAPKGGVRR